MAAKLRLSSSEAFLGILVGAVRADGKERREEFEVALHRIEKLEPVLRVSPLGFASALERLATLAREMGRDKFLAECVRAVPSGLRLPAFEAAVDIVTADREVTSEEVAHLHQLSRKLAIPKAVTDALLRTRAARA